MFGQLNPLFGSVEVTGCGVGDGSGVPDGGVKVGVGSAGADDGGNVVADSIGAGVEKLELKEEAVGADEPSGISVRGFGTGEFAVSAGVTGAAGSKEGTAEGVCMGVAVLIPIGAGLTSGIGTPEGG